MAPWLLILGFAISSSVDNLGVGICYGIRNIRVGILSNLLIAVICLLFSEAGILFGNWISTVLPGILPVVVGSFLLFIIGVRIILLTLPRKNQPSNKLVCDNEQQTRIIKEILDNPEIADADKSGEIGVGEAFILGIALSANALTNGLGAGLLGLSPHAISITAAIGSFLSIWAGVSLGHRVADVRIGSFTLGESSTILSGIILLAIAAHTLFS